MPFWECFLLVSFVATDSKSQLKPALCSSNKCSSCFYCCAINGFYGLHVGYKSAISLCICCQHQRLHGLFGASIKCLDISAYTDWLFQKIILQRCRHTCNGTRLQWRTTPARSWDLPLHSLTDHVQCNAPSSLQKYGLMSTLWPSVIFSIFPCYISLQVLSDIAHSSPDYLAFVLAENRLEIVWQMEILA